MKLERIGILNFEGLDEAVIELGGKGIVNFFAGPNGGGKSTIANAIEFGLTGKARGIKHAKDAKFLARGGKKGCKVKLKVAEHVITRTPTNINLSAEEVRKISGQPAMIEALLAASRFIELSPEKRREIVQKITADPDKIKAEILKHADAKVLTPKEVAAVIEYAVGGKMDKAEKLAVAGRQEVGRELNAITEAPSKTVTIDGEERNLEDCDNHKMRQLLKKLEASRDSEIERRGLAKRLGSAKDIKAEIEEIERAEFAEPCDEKHIEALVEKKDKAAKHLADVRIALATACAKMVATGALYKKVENLAAGSTCPSCQQEVAAKHVAALQQAAMEDGNVATKEHKAAKGLELKAVTVYDAAFDDLELENEALAKASEASEKLESLRENLAECGTYDGVEEAINELTVRIGTGMALIAAREAYDMSLAAQASRGLLERQGKAWDVLAKALGKDGPVRKVASAGFELAPVMASAWELLPARDVTVDGDWEIFVDGIPAHIILSKSERLRLGAAFAAELAVASGVGLLVIDEADMLEADLRSVFIGWLSEQSERLETVIAMATTTTPPAPQDWLKVWTVADGGCVAVEA